MRPNNQPTGKIELYREDAEGSMQMKTADISEIKLDFKEVGNEVYGVEINQPIAISVEIPKGLRCTNRKRFVKLLMSCGVERNAAVKAAFVATKYGVSYQTHFLAVIFLLGKEKLEKERINKNEPGTFEQ